MHVTGFMRESLRLSACVYTVSLPSALAYQAYAVFGSDNEVSFAMPALSLTVIENTWKFPWRYFVGVLGMPGQTAYYGLKDISRPKSVS